MPISGRRAFYEWAALALLLAGPLIGPVLFGAVRTWSVGPLMLMAWAGIAMCLFRPLLRPELRVLQIPAGGLPALAFLAYSALLIPGAAVPYEARMEMLRIGSYVGAYWAWTELAARRKRWRILIGLVLFGVTLLGWYALIQHMHGSRMVLNLERPEQYGWRASGTYFCPNHFANLIALILPFALVLLFLRSAGLPLRLLSGYSLLLLLPVLYLTESRSGWLGAAAGLGLTASLMALRRSIRRFLVILVLIPILVALLAAALWVVSPRVRARLEGARLEHPDSAVAARFMVWGDTLPLIAERPVLGHGPGSYQWVYPRFRRHVMPYLINYAHNEYLQAVAEYGLVGLGLAGLAIVWGLGMLLRGLRTVQRDKDAYFIAALCGSVAAGAVHALFDFNFHIYSNNHVLILLAGLVSAGLYGSGDWRPVALPGIRGLLVWGGGLAVTAILGVLTVQVLASYGLHFVGELHRKLLDADTAISFFQKACWVDPGNWRPYTGLGHTYRTRGFWDLDADRKKENAEQALSFYEQALARNPLDMMTLYGLSRTYELLGDQEKALELLRDINARDRLNPFYTGQLGLQLRNMGRYEEALDVFREAADRWGSEMAVINIRLLEHKLAETGQSTSAP